MYKCGAFYISVYNSVNGAAWSIGASISFKTIYKATNTTYAFRGGYCSIELYCGFICVRLGVAFSGANWNTGASLSFKPFPSFYCDNFYQYYTNTRYVLRGGTSTNELTCGFACVYLKDVFSNTFWSVGAALSFKL